MTISIELARQDDVEELADLLAALFAQESDFTPDRSKQLRGLSLIIEQPHMGRIIVLREDDLILGMVNLLFTISTAEGGMVAILEDMVIHPDHRRRGLGSLLLRYAIEVARKNGCLRITLLTDRLNEKAISFYQRHSFQLSAMVPMRLALTLL